MADYNDLWEHLQTETVEVFAGSGARLGFMASRFSAGEKVLDIGAGSGMLEEFCLARGVDVYALDPGPKTIERLRARLGLGGKAAVGSSDKIPFPDASFDAVAMSEVLEHLPPDVMAASLAEVRRVLRPGGRFVGTVPCAEVLAELESVCPKCGERFHKWGHRQSFTPESLRASLAGSFASVGVERRLFVPWSSLNWKGRLQGAVNRVLHSMGLLGDARLNIFFTCVK